MDPPTLASSSIADGRLAAESNKSSLMTADVPSLQPFHQSRLSESLVTKVKDSNDSRMMNDLQKSSIAGKFYFSIVQRVQSHKSLQI